MSHHRYSNENGAVLYVALLVMAVITVLGLIASRTSVVETQIAANQKRIDEELANAEAALNLAVRQFRNLDTIQGSQDSIATVLNDTRFQDFRQAIYSGNSSLKFPGTAISVARVEIRRIVNDEDPDKQDRSYHQKTDLSDQADNVPKLSHRYYAGSIDKKRFAITVTAYKKNSNELSNTWVQKGVTLPVEQDSDLF